MPARQTKTKSNERKFFRGGISRLSDIPDQDFISGAGSLLIDSAGRECVDLFASAGVVSLGHCDPGFINEIRSLSEGLFSCPTPSESRISFWNSLSPHLPPELDRVYFFSSGAEANEAAIRIAQASTARTYGAHVRNSYHGRTHSTAALSGAGRKPNLTLNAGCDVGSTIANSGIDPAYVIFEPIQGRPLRGDFDSAN